jgi:saccharopine dehydrogenase-like NADP-dependent oxidoreductase
MKSNHSIFIAGAGGIGRTVALFLATDEELQCDIYIGDISDHAIQDAIEWIQKGLTIPKAIRPVLMAKEGSNQEMDDAFNDVDIIMDCLPGSQAPRMAQFARANGLHYVNLTEYVKETEEIIEIGKNADTGFVLQTGLAPGFINVLGHKLFKQFCKMYDVDKVEKISKRVGALTKYTRSPHFYGFTWSPIGVATEYVKDSIVVRDGKIVYLPSLSERETILIDGVQYEADLTSGGVADLPNALRDQTKDLDYKTIRYPGHYDWVKGIIGEISSETEKIQKLEKIMLKQIPAVEEDVVIIYAAVKGRDRNGKLRAIETSFKIKPMQVGNQTLRAIQSTTAAPMAECARMLLLGNYKGIIYQSDLNTEEFMEGPIIQRVYFEKTLQKKENHLHPAEL